VWGCEGRVVCSWCVCVVFQSGVEDGWSGGWGGGGEGLVGGGGR